jgi:hypothetical protein
LENRRDRRLQDVVPLQRKATPEIEH